MIDLIMKSFIIDFGTSSIFFEIFVLSHLILENVEVPKSIMNDFIIRSIMYNWGDKIVKW